MQPGKVVDYFTERPKELKRKEEFQKEEHIQVRISLCKGKQNVDEDIMRSRRMC